MKLAVLHLSDIHFHGDSDPIFARATDIAESALSVVRNAELCLIAVTSAWPARAAETVIRTPAIVSPKVRTLNTMFSS